MHTSPQPKAERISYRSPDTAHIHLSQKIEAIYNSLREHRLELKEPGQSIDIYTPDTLIRILDAKVIPLNYYCHYFNKTSFFCFFCLLLRIF